MSDTAVLFDLDGILVDSEPVWYAVESALVERLGGVWGEHHQAHCIGGTIDATCRYIGDLTGTDRSLDDLRDEILADMTRHFTDALPVHDGALELVDAVRRLGVRTALVSSSFRVLVDAALVRLGAHRFDVTVAGDEVLRGKPDPEPYRTACEQLGVRPAAAVVVEDALNGVLSAEAAGCPVVVVPSVTPIEGAPGRHLADTVRGIDPHWLVGLTRSRSPEGRRGGTHVVRATTRP